MLTVTVVVVIVVVKAVIHQLCSSVPRDVQPLLRTCRVATQEILSNRKLKQKKR